MSRPFSDHFSGVAGAYAEFRPRYPEALFDWLADLAPGREVAWDCATGSGQAARALARRFERVVATDASAEQIAAAPRHPRVEYRVAPAESSGLDAGSIDLITVAQALHWFDRPAFYGEAERVVRPDGVLAVWTYGHPRLDDPDTDALFQLFYSGTVGPYWPPERALVDAGYRTIEFPFPEVDPPPFEMGTHWTLAALLGYVATWSATTRFRSARGFDPVPALGEALARAWGNPGKPAGSDGRSRCGPGDVADRLIETRLGDRVRVWTLGGERLETSYGANCTAVAGGDAVLLVDPLIAPAHARLVEDAVRAWTDRPVRFVVLTHNHTDHALGAAWFASLGATVVAHRACGAAMEREHAGLIQSRRKIPALAELFRDAEPHAPSLLLDGDEWKVDLGGATARARHPGPGHTPGDLVVSLDDAEVTVCGDLVSVRYHVNYEDAALERLESGLDALAATETRTYVPGHGAAGGPEILQAQREYHRAVADAAAENVEEGIANLRRRYPGYRLKELLPQSIAAWRERGVS